MIEIGDGLNCPLTEIAGANERIFEDDQPRATSCSEAPSARLFSISPKGSPGESELPSLDFARGDVPWVSARTLAKRALMTAVTLD
jgi:hypothetical protein